MFIAVNCMQYVVDGAHNVATSRQTSKIMDIFKEKMGAHNYVILNALRGKEELRVAATTQEGSATNFC